MGLIQYRGHAVLILIIFLSSGLGACSEPVTPITPSPLNKLTPGAVTSPSVPITQTPTVEGKLEILEHHLAKKGDTISVVGTARNNGSSVITYSEVIARFFDAKGKLVEIQDSHLCGSPVLTEWRDMKIEKLNPGEKWDFEIVFLAWGSDVIKDYEIYVGAIR